MMDELPRVVAAVERTRADGSAAVAISGTVDLEHDDLHEVQVSGRVTTDLSGAVDFRTTRAYLSGTVESHLRGSVESGLGQVGGTRAMSWLFDGETTYHREADGEWVHMTGQESQVSAQHPAVFLALLEHAALRAESADCNVLVVELGADASSFLFPAHPSLPSADPSLFPGWAATITLDDHGRIRRIRLDVTGRADIPMRLSETVDFTDFGVGRVDVGVPTVSVPFADFAERVFQQLATTDIDDHVDDESP